MTIRNRYLLLLDILLIFLAVATAFALRFDTVSVWDYLSQNWFFLPLLLVIRLPLFYLFGLYRRLWRYASVNEFVAIAEAILLGSALAAMLILLVLAPLGFISGFPRSIILLEGMLTLLLVGGLRFSFRLWRGAPPHPQEVTSQKQNKFKQRALIFGAGDAGTMIVREIRANPTVELEPIAFLDDDASKKGSYIHNLPVLGDRHALAEVVQAQHIGTVIIAMPKAPGRVIRDITQLCHQIGVPVKTVPGLYEILGGSVKVSAIREVELDDLLRREPVTIDLPQIGQYLGGARVLVTGAGGSIGSELCRQIAPFAPERLILFELSENNLYQIHRQLVAYFPALLVTPIVGDVRDKEKVGAVLAQQQPQVVFHAAAHKHVPLMEANVDEVVANNVFGTRHVLEASIHYGVNRFVLVSTDKAVNPKSVMGASKRVAELLVQEAAHRNGSAFVAVRFGNVLGSSGSVVPLFKEQIAAGGPVTVTHPDIQRYFMTIPEAVSLIIQAAALGKGGEIFVLDMGEPVKIKDLAGDLIRLSGFEPGQDIEIVFTGLRPGEKLREELFTAQEQCQSTKHQQIFVARADRDDSEKLQRGLAELESLVFARDGAKIKEKLKEIVPEYEPET
jgi:FlaA1/EpsC-like NDP-sugar epimerase